MEGGGGIELTRSKRKCSVERVDQVWSTDTTYLRLPQRFVHLAAMMDWFSLLRAELAAAAAPGSGLLCRGLEGPAATGASRDLQQRSRIALHQRVGGTGYCDQHGWARAVSGQHLHRAAVALVEIRRGLSEGSRGSLASPGRHRALLSVLQSTALASGPRLSNSSRDQRWAAPHRKR
jgi:hypothetical protein